MSKKLTFLLLIVAALLCFAGVGLGQERFGTIEGTVKDPQGAVVPGAQVTVTSKTTTTGTRPDLSLAYNRTVTTDDSGFYRLTDVPPGFYNITVAPTGGFGGATAENVEVTLGKATPVNVALAVAGQTATVNVTSTATAPIDTTDNKIQTNITAQTMELLPKGQGVSSLWKIAPSTRPEALNGGFQVDGASGSENTFILDGQEVTHFRTGVLRANDNLPFNIVQETSIKSSGFEAEFGGATGGVMNVVTKGGTNDWHGDFGIGFQLSGLQADPRPFLRNFRTGSATATPSTFIDIPEYIQPVKDGGNTYLPAASLGGPIVRDHLWFFASWSPQFENTNRTIPYISSDPRNRTTSETLVYNFKRTRQFADIRLDGSPNSQWNFTGRFIWSPIEDEGALPGFTEMTASPQQALIGGQVLRGPAFLGQQGGRQNSNNLTASATYTPNSRFVFSARAGRTFLNEKLGSYGIPTTIRYLCSTSSSASVAAAAGCVPGQQNFATNFQVAFDVSTRRTFDIDGSWLVSGLGGRHQFKGGYQWNSISNQTDQGYANIGQLTMIWNANCDSADPNIDRICGIAFQTGQLAAPGAVGVGVLQRFGTIGSASSANQGVYFQDRWQPHSRLSLNIGLRLEKEDVPSFSAGNPGIVFGWGSKPAPRLGFAWDITGSGRHKLFASYGWFYDRFKYELPRGSFGGDFFRRDYFDLFPGDTWNSITVAQIIAGFADPLGGGGCASDNPAVRTAPGARSRCQFDFRIPSNLVGGDLFASGNVDPNIKAARQDEFTVGYESELPWSNFFFRSRYTRKQVKHAIEDVGLPTASGSEAYIIGNPGEGLVAEIGQLLGFPTPKATRQYDAFEVQIDKRFSNHYFFNANYTYSRLVGNYSGLASSLEFGRVSPNVSRLFDLPFQPFTLNGDPIDGRLPTDRPHVLKFYGAYEAAWGGGHTTEFSGFQTAQSGTPVTSVITFFNLNPTVVNGLGDLGRTEAFTQTDFAIRHKIRFKEKYILALDLDILNLFNEDNELQRATTLSPNNITDSSLRTGGCPAAACANEVAVINRIFNGGVRDFALAFINGRADRQQSIFNRTNGFQAPRSITFGVRFLF